MSRKTERMELVETHNMALSLKRLHSDADEYAWRRAFLHALGMAGCSWDMQKKIREALELP